MADDKKQKTLFLDDPNAGAPPPAAPPLSSQSTMMMEAPQQSAAPQQAQRQMVVPTIMKLGPQGELPPMHRRKKPSTAGRWIAGPIISIVVAAGTVYAAGILLPKKPKPGTVVPAGPTKPQGKLRVNTDPIGATIRVDGKRFPRFTPTTVEGDIGSTLKLTFQLEGYRDNEAEVIVAAGEHNFNVKLESLTPAAPVTPVAAPAPAKKEHHHSSAPKEPEGKGKLSVLVRPWAIVYVDGVRLKQTPVNAYELKSGPHLIELVNENKNRREKVQITLKPGAEEELRRDWDK
jgi:hypothetical protein